MDILMLLLEIIIYMPCDWLKNNQSQAAIGTSAAIPSTRVFQIYGLITLSSQRKAARKLQAPESGCPDGAHTHVADQKISYSKPFESTRPIHQNHIEL